MKLASLQSNSRSHTDPMTDEWSKKEILVAPAQPIRCSDTAFTNRTRLLVDCIYRLSFPLFK